MAIAGLIFTALPASASEPTLPVGAGTHNCEVIGHDAQTQAVVCIDLINVQYTGSGVIFEARLEGMCQTIATGALTQCAEIDAVVGGFTSGSPVDPVYLQCGHAAGPCGGGRNYFNQDYQEYFSGCPTSPGGPNDTWAVAFADSTVGSTAIELPQSAVWTHLPANFSSGHYFLCT